MEPKTGGLGDVVGGLPIELAKRGHKVMTVAPRYDQYWQAWDTSVRVPVQDTQVGFFHVIEKGVDRVFVDHPLFLGKVNGKTGAKLYGPATGADYDDNQRRFRLFNEAAIEASRCLPFSPGEDVVFVANDWHSCLVAVLLKGRNWEKSFPELNLPQETLELFKFTDGVPKIFSESDPATEEPETKYPKGQTFQKLNWMKAGILSCDKVLTVSPNYAHEITKDEEMGVELDKYLRQVGGVEGIVNGMDITDWNPSKNKYLKVTYNANNVDQGKKQNKALLQKEVGLPVADRVPLFGFIGRLEEQKGVDILIDAIPKIAKQNVQVIIMGTGKAKLEKKLKALDEKYPNVKCVVKFSIPIAHTLFAGTDYMIIPSRFEPCGLIQLQAMCYGSIPIATSVGGLVDTVKENKTGYLIPPVDLNDILDKDTTEIAEAVKKAANEYGSQKFFKLRYNCIGQDLTWKEPAKKWEGMLEQIKFGVPAGVAKKEQVKTPVANDKLVSV